MKRICLWAMLVPLFTFGQSNDSIVNPKGKWYFGAEMGSNAIRSFYDGDAKLSLQGGVLAEYYFARHWSLSGRIKYFETGVSFSTPDKMTHGNFQGSTITVPLNVKWEFRVYKNLRANLKFGGAYALETKSEYSNYSANQITDYPKQYMNLNLGFGFNYFMTKKIAFYLDIESYSGASRGVTNSFLLKDCNPISNDLINIGVKYNFSK